MTDSNYTHLLTIVDRSGSMRPVRDDMVGALDSFFEAQAAEDGKCLVDYVQFDDTYEHVYKDALVADAKAVLEPRGMTALLDAIGKSVTSLGERFAKMDEADRPGTVIVAVVTDGHENASQDWTAESVKALIEQQENEWNWEFNFLGANMDAVAVGRQFGFKEHNTLTYDTAFAGATSVALASNVTRSRKGDKSGYTQDDRNAAVGNNS